MCPYVFGVKKTCNFCLKYRFGPFSHLLALGHGNTFILIIQKLHILCTSPLHFIIYFTILYPYCPSTFTSLTEKKEFSALTSTKCRCNFFANSGSLHRNRLILIPKEMSMFSHSRCSIYFILYSVLLQRKCIDSYPSSWIARIEYHYA
jgi:hypothetical protein